MTQEGVSPAFVAAKLARPRVGRVPLRPQTAAAFELATGRRLAVICAPAGYGKTTLVAEMADRLDLDILWYKLDVLDHDPIVTIVSLTHAAQERCPGFGDVLLERVRSSAEIPFRLPETVALFVKECTDKIDDPIHIVLDDYHEAADSHDLNWTLDYLLENLPSRFRFIVLSRYDPAFSLAKLRLADQVSLLGVDVLRFDVDQAVDVLQSRSGHLPPRAAVERLVELTEGWPASLVLASFALEWLDVDSLETALSDPRLRHDIYSYLAEQVYLREDEDTRHFLRQTCFLEHVTAELGDRLAATANAHQQLTHLAARQVFTFATAREGAFRYHNLFRDHIRQRLQQEFGATGFRDVQVRTIEALEACGEAELAVDSSLAMNEPLRALEIIARMGDPGFENVRTESLESWVSRLDWSTALLSPWTDLLRAQLCLRDGNFSRALEEIDEALSKFDDSGNRLGKYHSLSARECVLFWKGDMNGASESCQAALANADTPAQRAHSLISLGSAAQELRDWNSADVAYIEAERLIVGIDSSDHKRLRALKALMEYYKGNARAAYVVVQGALDGEPANASTALILNSLGLFELALAEYASSEMHLREALGIAERFGNRHFVPVIQDCLGSCLAAQGHAEDAMALLTKSATSDTIRSDSASLALVNSHLGTVLRRAGRLEEALHYYEMAVDTLLEGRDNFASLNCRANLAFLERLLGHESSQSLLDIATEAMKHRLEFVSLKARLFEAATQANRNHREEAHQLLCETAPQLLRLGHVNFLAQEMLCNTILAPYLIATLPEDEETERLMQLVKASSHLPQPAKEARRKAAGGMGLGELTRREIEVLSHMADGLRNDEIAAKLFVSLATVKTHVNHIFSKLGVSDRVHAVLAYKTALENKSSALDDD